MVGMSETPPEHDRYARWLAASSRLAFVALLVAFAAYVLGLLPAAISVERVPELWSRPASQLLAAAAPASAVSWWAWLAQAEVLNLAAVVLLASCPIPAVLAAVPVFRARGERAVMVLCLLQAAIVVGAALGVFLR